MTKQQTDDTNTTETAYKRGYRQGVQDALKTTELKTIEMNPRIEVWDWAGVKLAEWLAAGKVNDEKPPQPRG
jgi:hypothetical protein